MPTTVLEGEVDRITALGDILILIPGTRGSSLTRPKRLCRLIKWRILGGEDDSGLSGWAWCDQKGPCKERGKLDSWGQSQRDLKMLCCWLCRWRKGHSRGLQVPPRHGPGRATDALLDPPEGTQPCWYLELSPGILFSGSWPPQV